MSERKQQKIDEHNYNYWLKKNTSNQLRAKPLHVQRRLKTRAQVALALACATGAIAQ